jgi:hypothetical protein
MGMLAMIYAIVLGLLVCAHRADATTDAIQVLANAPARVVALESNATAVSGRVNNAVSEIVAVSGRVNNAVSEIVAVSGRVDLAATALEMVAVSGRVDTVEGIAGSALQPGVITVTGATNGADTAVITVANTLGATTVMCGWWSSTAGGAADTNGLVSFVAGANTLVLSDAASPTVVFRSHTTGTGLLTVTVDQPRTNYFNVVQRDGAIKSSAAVSFDGP